MFHDPQQETLHPDGPGKSYLGCADDSEDPALPFSLLIYGGGGDLSRKKLLPNLFHLFVHGWLPSDFAIVCAGSPQDATQDSFRILVKESLEHHAKADFSTEAWERFVAHIFFLALRFDNDDKFAELKALVEKVSPRDESGTIQLLHFMAVPPAAFASVIRQTGRFGMNGPGYSSRLIIEKPFGTDLASARELNEALAEVFREDQLYRIDHYLGKETVQNILFFRFSNSMFEPLWNNRYIDNIQITVAEDIGIEKRGKFYEPSGVIRDIIQNHALQVLSLIAMEPPADFDASCIRDEKAKVCRSLSPMTKEEILRDTVVGQYLGGTMAGKGTEAGHQVKAYRQEDFVSPDSSTPTFFAGKFTINNWRWAGVPIYVRAGKRLGSRQTDVVIEFRKASHQMFGQCQNREPGTLTLSIQPEESITMRYEVKYPNTTKRVWPVAMTFNYDEEFRIQTLPAYARLVLDALKGDLSLFVRQDGIESMWQFADPIIHTWDKEGAKGLRFYQPGSQGPTESLELLHREGRHWHSNLGGS